MKTLLIISSILLSYFSFGQKKENKNDRLVKFFEQKLKTVNIEAEDSAYSGVALLKLPASRKDKAVIINEIPDNYANHINAIIAADSMSLLLGFKKNAIFPIVFLNLQTDIARDEEVGVIQGSMLISAMQSLSKKRRQFILSPAIIVRPDQTYKRRN